MNNLQLSFTYLEAERMKNQIKFLLILSSLIWAFASVSCNNELKENPTYYTVSFDSDGGSFVAAQTVESGKTAVEPRSPTKSGYTFDDWYKDSSVFDFSTPITSNLTLKGKWTKIQNNDSQNDNNTEENGNENKTDKTSPAEVSGLTATENHKRVVLNWTNPADEDFASVEITCEPAEGSLSEPQIIQGNPSEEKSYTISNLENDKEYKITIKTIDSNNNKSTGVIKTASPKESKINLKVSLPNDDGENVILTNDKATINVTISPTDQVVKAVWKKGVNPGSAGEALLSDDSATALVFNSNTASFTVTENGYYDIAVRNSEGVTECIRTIIRTIDKTPLAEVTNLTSESDGQNIYVSWENPASQNKYDRNFPDIIFYDSPLKTVILSYVYNDDESDAANGEITLGSGITTATIPIADGKTEDDFVRITVKVLDEVGNVNEGKSIKGFCQKYIGITNTNAKKKLESISENSTIIAMGDITVEIIAAALRQFQENQPEIRINLDLSQVESISCYGSTTEIGMYSFSNCSSLNNITLPDNVTTIRTLAFSGCINLETITIPNSVLEIESDAFGHDWDSNSHCSKLTKINYIGTIEDWCSKTWFLNFTTPYDLYINNQKVTDVIIPNTINRISNKAFYNCSSITSILIENGVTIVGNYAFAKCSNLTSITIPSSIISADSTDPDSYNWFSGCDKISIINYTGTIEQWSSRTWGFWFRCPYDLYINNQKITNVELLSGITSISDYAFANCSSLSSIDIPYGVSSIGDYAFCSCSNLTNATIPDTVTDIGEAAFKSCTGLTKITIPDNVTNIGDDAFSYCDNITDITLSGETKLGNAFRYGSIPIKKVTFSKKVTPFNLILPCEELYLKDNVTEIPQISNSSERFTCLKTITIPPSVTKISDNAFYFLKNLEKIYYTGGIDQWCQMITFGTSWIGNWDGYGVSIYIDGNLLSGDLEIPEGIVNINARAFLNCAKLTSVKFPNSLRNIGDSSFSDCYKISSINLGLGVKTIGKHAFYNVPCSNASITIPSSLCKIGAYALPTTSSITYTFVDTGTNWYNSETGVSVGAKPITAIKSGTGIHSSKYNGE